jgi:hypothetical protein
MWSWNTLLRWLGVGAFLYEMFQPLAHRPVEPIVMGIAAAMMGIDFIKQSDKDKDE